MSNLYSLVMAGGRGTRFWPESTSKKPKQYLSLVSDNSLLNETLQRFTGLVAPEKRYVVTVKEQEALAQTESAGEIATNGLIFEPAGRNTAPCILLALAHLVTEGASDDDVVAIVPSDHVILNKSGFRKVIEDASLAARENDSIVTIGINPNFPHTGYGYIHRGESVGNIFNVKAFKEKPDFDTAKSYIESGEYYWNAGMFVAKVGVLLKEFSEHSPEHFAHYESLLSSINDPGKLATTYDLLPKDSVDYAIMEKSTRVQVIPSQFDWNDLGSWDALESVLEREDDNFIAKAKDHCFLDAKNNIIFTPNKFVSLIGVENLIVTCTDDVVLVADKKESQRVKEVVQHLQESNAGAELI